MSMQDFLRGQDRSRLTMDSHFGKGSSFPSVLRRIIDSRFFLRDFSQSPKSVYAVLRF